MLRDVGLLEQTGAARTAAGRVAHHEGVTRPEGRGAARCKHALCPSNGGEWVVGNRVKSAQIISAFHRNAERIQVSV